MQWHSKQSSDIDNDHYLSSQGAAKQEYIISLACLVIQKKLNTKFISRYFPHLQWIVQTCGTMCCIAHSDPNSSANLLTLVTAASRMENTCISI
jgi:hypothetical protein